MAPPSVNSSQHAANAGRMIKATRARITTATTRPCSQCHKPVPTYQTWKMCDACRERCRTISLERRRRQRETGGMFSIFKVDLSAGYTGPQKGTKRSIDNEDNGGVGEEGSVRIVKRSRKDSETEDVDRTSNCKENENATNTICENGDHQVCRNDCFFSPKFVNLYQNDRNAYWNLPPNRLSSKLRPIYTALSHPNSSLFMRAIQSYLPPLRPSA